MARPRWLGGYTIDVTVTAGDPWTEGDATSPEGSFGGVTVASDAGLTLKSGAGRGVLAATVLGSGLAQLDGTVVNVALPRIGTDLDAGLTALQWTVNAYT